MTRNIPLKGIIAQFTPFTTDGSVDIAKYKLLLERMVAAGVHAVAPLGSAGDYLISPIWNAKPSS